MPAKSIAIGLNLLIQYRGYLRREGCRETCISKHTQIIFAFLLPLENKPLAKITRKDILNYRRCLAQKNLAAKTINRHLCALEVFFDWLKSKDCIRINPISKKGGRNA